MCSSAICNIELGSHTDSMASILDLLFHFVSDESQADWQSASQQIVHLASDLLCEFVSPDLQQYFPVLLTESESQSE
jgi:hypothetical protein